MRKIALKFVATLLMSASTALSAATAPAFTKSLPNVVTGKVGSTLTYSVTTSGTAPLTYKWYWNGTLISGATTSSYITPKLTANDNYANIEVSVSNSAGSANSYSNLRIVSSAPVIYDQPTSITVQAPSLATFSVDSDTTVWSGGIFQWYKNGIAIAGATTNSYTLLESSTADNGAKFLVKISNAAGTTTSSAATLTVKAAAAAGSYPIVGMWSGTATITGVDPDTGDAISPTVYSVTSVIAQNSYALSAVFASTDTEGTTDYGSGLAALNTLNFYTKGGDMSIAGAFSTDKYSFTGMAASDDGVTATGTFALDSTRNKLTGSSTTSKGSTITYSLTRVASK